MARTAHDLIESIFSRPQASVPGNVRYISVDQLSYLLDLIGRGDGATLQLGSGGRLYWTPQGNHRFEIEGDIHAPRRKVTRYVQFDPGAAGSLFG